VVLSCHQWVFREQDLNLGLEPVWTVSRTAPIPRVPARLTLDKTFRLSQVKRDVSEVEAGSCCTESVDMRNCLPPTDKGGRMEGSSGNVVLWCEGCGERTTLGDPLSVWRSGRTSFECGCGASLTLSDRLEPGQTSESIEAGAAAVNR
jgi:hypothetical protein